MTLSLNMNCRIFFGFIVLALAATTGCSRPSALSVATSHSRLFPAGRLKQDLGTVITALRTNGYVAAEVTLVKMQRQNLNARQLDAIHDTMRRLNEEAVAAAASGSVSASNELRELTRTNYYLF